MTHVPRWHPLSGDRRCNGASGQDSEHGDLRISSFRVYVHCGHNALFVLAVQYQYKYQVPGTSILDIQRPWYKYSSSLPVAPVDFSRSHSIFATNTPVLRLPVRCSLVPVLRYCKESAVCIQGTTHV